MAIRPIASPPEALIAHRLGTITMAVYAPQARREDAEFAGSVVDWIGLDDQVRFPAFADWMRRQGFDRRCGLRIDSMPGMTRAAAAGAGCALLPCYLGDREPGLRRVPAAIDAPEIALWLLIHPDLRRTARVRAVRSFMQAVFERPDIQRVLAGEY